jgi:hypothetical protein
MLKKLLRIYHQPNKRFFTLRGRAAHLSKVKKKRMYRMDQLQFSLKSIHKNLKDSKPILTSSLRSSAAHLLGGKRTLNLLLQLT